MYAAWSRLARGHKHRLVSKRRVRPRGRFLACASRPATLIVRRSPLIEVAQGSLTPRADRIQKVPGAVSSIRSWSHPSNLDADGPCGYSGAGRGDPAASALPPAEWHGMKSSAGAVQHGRRSLKIFRSPAAQKPLLVVEAWRFAQIGLPARVPPQCPQGADPYSWRRSGR